MNVEVVKCKTCGTIIAACIEFSMNNPEWLKSKLKYARTENVIFEIVTEAVDFSDELKKCCGKKIKT